MIDPWATGATMARLWTMSVETWSATAVVLAKRSAMLGNAAWFPAALDMRELGRMVPEKVDAVSRGVIAAAGARDPLDAATRMLAPVHARVTRNARRLRGG
jgi:hypothetical protein